MKVLIACECSGVVRDAFLMLGHDAWSCDIKPDESSSIWSSDRHYQACMFDVIDNDNWDLIVAHPPCTYLSSSGMHWTTRGLRDPQLTIDALDFVKNYLSIVKKRKIMSVMENPVGVISTRLRKPDQYIQPYDFGDDASKKTCLWLDNGAPRLKSTNHIAGRIVKGKRRWSNQTDSGQNRIPPSSDRGAARSVTYPGIASALAWQIGGWNI